MDSFSPDIVLANLELIGMLRKDLFDALPPSYKRVPLIIFADPHQIALVLDALVFNAIKYSKIGGEINLRVQRTMEGKAHVSISDKGIGISKEYLDKIFNRFFQVRNSFLNKNEGVGVGSTFHFTLLPSHVEDE